MQGKMKISRARLATQRVMDNSPIQIPKTRKTRKMIKTWLPSENSLEMPSCTPSKQKVITLTTRIYLLTQTSTTWVSATKSPSTTLKSISAS